MKNEVAVVTGGAGHLGSAICRGLAEKGVNIAVIDKNKDAGTTLQDSLKKEFSVEAKYFEFDLLEPECFKLIEQSVIGHFGQIDSLVNNAAFYDSFPGWGVHFEEEGYEAWLKVLQVNLLAPFFLVQAFAPRLRESNNAAVVNISTIYAKIGPDPKLYEGTDMTNEAAYTASKGGLTALTRWLSTMLAPSIRVNSVTPGGIERGQAKEFIDRYNQKTPLNRMATEEDIAHSVCFLLSSQSAYMTGHDLVVDGGLTIR